MKKQFRFFATVWVTLFVLFNIITFAATSLIHMEEYTTSFLIGYLLITVIFAGHLICGYVALSENNSQKMFYRISLIRSSYAGLFLTFLAGILCMLIYELPTAVAIIVGAIALTIQIVPITKTSAAITAVEQVDTKVKQQTMFIKSLTVYADNTLAHAKNEDAKAICKKVYEAVRYSDPMSNSALSDIESQLTIRFAALTNAVQADNIDEIKTTAEEILILLKDRNQKCMLLK